MNGHSTSPVLFILAAIGISAAIGWHNHALRHIHSINAIRGGPDDYFEGLAKLGIARGPSDERPSLDEHKLTPVIAH